MRSDLDVVTAATRSADLLREGRALLLSLVDHAAARPRGSRADGLLGWAQVVPAVALMQWPKLRSP
ncbi:hypothetical protein ILP97_02660 [Amycolatopsis sp. H6(2020)]|nr:hypothetical protein [Amycolatopsis sp. H6(2020)]